MRGILKSLAVVNISIYFTQQLIPTIVIANINTFIILSGLIFLTSIVIDPLTKILFFIPTTFLVLNLAQFIGVFLVLFFASKSLAEFEINSFDFSGFTDFGISIQAQTLTALQVTFISAFIIYLVSGFLRWLVD